MSLDSGKKGAPEWTEVSSVHSDKNKVKCDHCGIEVRAKIEKIRILLNKCLKRHKNSVPIKIQISANITSLPLENNVSTSAASYEKQDSNEVSVSTSTVSFKRRKTLSDYTVKITNSQKTTWIWK